MCPQGKLARRKSKLRTSKRKSSKSVLETMPSESSPSTSKCGKTNNVTAHKNKLKGSSSKNEVINSPRLLSRHLTRNSEIAVYWPDDKTHYPGVVGARQKGQHVYAIHYDDGEVEEYVDLTVEKFRLIGHTASRVIGDLRTKLEEQLLQNANSSAAQQQILSILQDDLGSALISDSVTFSVLHQTGIDRVLNKLCKDKHANISKAAIIILDEWKRIAEETPPEVQVAVLNANATKVVDGAVEGEEGETVATVNVNCTTPRSLGAGMIDLTESPLFKATKKIRIDDKSRSKAPCDKRPTKSATVRSGAAEITPVSTQSMNIEPSDLTSSSMFKENKVNEVSVDVLSSKHKQKCDAALPTGDVTSSIATASSKPNKTAPVIQSGSCGKWIEPPPPKKKKLSFHDQILYTMLTECKPYTPKSLAKKTSITVEALAHAMLSFLDKKLVLSKEFPVKKGSRKEPKVLYWANPLTLTEINVELSGNGKRKNGGGAIVKDFSKLLSTSEEIEEAKQLHQTLEQRHQELKNELIPLLAIPTMKELDHQIMAEEQKLSEALREIQAVRDRMANSSDEQSRDLTTNIFGAHANAPTNRFRKKDPLKPCDPTTLKRKINYMLCLYKTRKRKCVDFVEELSEAMEKKTKDVMDKVLRLDTDEIEWEWYEDRGTGKVFGTRLKRQKFGMSVAGRKEDSNNEVLAMAKEDQRPTVIIPAKYKV